jgi:uncharacterized DUF497 family protein
MNKSIEIEKCIGFDWDEGNILKNWEKHRVSASECEQIFFNRPLITAHDKKHSEEELRSPFYSVYCSRILDKGYFSKKYESKRKGTVRKIMKKKIPKFKSYVDWDRGNRLVLQKLKPSLKTISLRLPEPMLAELKLLANKRDVPYQSLLKIFLAERIEQELR